MIEKTLVGFMAGTLRRVAGGEINYEMTPLEQDGGLRLVFIANHDAVGDRQVCFQDRKLERIYYGKHRQTICENAKHNMMVQWISHLRKSLTRYFDKFPDAAFPIGDMLIDVRMLAPVERDGKRHSGGYLVGIQIHPMVAMENSSVSLEQEEAMLRRAMTESLIPLT